MTDMTQLRLRDGRTLTWAQRPLVMGILNVTPDSFSDGGRFRARDTAIAQAVKMAQEGADIIDIGGESTRPNASPVSAQEELDRVLPVLEAVLQQTGLPVSIDTWKGAVAAAALATGAVIVNDVWGFQRDETIATITAKAGAPAILMHNRDSIDPELDIMADAQAFLRCSVALALEAGVAAEHVFVDPGIGFGKTVAQNLTMVARLAELKQLGYPVLLGVSRKSMIGHVTGETVPDNRLAGTLATNVFGAIQGAAILRVHDVKPHIEALKMLAALNGAL
jgi:dihydropteroate synthase